jgi:hypothetical protein
MNIPDQDHIDKVILWISYAEEDLGLARFALEMPGSRPYRLIAFHAQQCAFSPSEKAGALPDMLSHLKVHRSENTDLILLFV